MQVIVTDAQGRDVEVAIKPFCDGDWQPKIHLTAGAGETFAACTACLTPDSADALAAALAELAAELRARQLADDIEAAAAADLLSA